MIDKPRIEQAQKNVRQYVEDGLLKKEKQELAKQRYIENSQQSLNLANSLLTHPSKPYSWIIVISYYAMFYISNAILLHFGYKTQEKIVHKVTNEALIVFILPKLTKELLEEYEEIKENALEIAQATAEELVTSYSLELNKRSQFQYNMLEETKAAKAKTSVERASKFIFEMKKLLE